MSRSKKIFVALAIVFFCLLALVVYDISSRTTFPGSKEKSTPATHQLPIDSTGADTGTTQDTLQ